MLHNRWVNPRTAQALGFGNSKTKAMATTTTTTTPMTTYFNAPITTPKHHNKQTL